MTSRSTRVFRELAALGVVVTLVAACGSDDDATSDSTASSASPSTADATSTSTSTSGIVDSSVEGSTAAPENTSATETTTTALELSPADGDVRGFDGTTVRVASIGIKTQLPSVESGAQARIKRFNDTGEIDGVRIEYVEYADDKLDPASALSEVRRLATAEDVFAIVGDTSPVNPLDYFVQEHLPYFGWAIDHTYCAAEPDTEIWGFGYSGCSSPSISPEYFDAGRGLLEYVQQQTGEDAPSVAVFTGDSGSDLIKMVASSFHGVGFHVVYHKAVLPTPVTDYTPYVQDLLTSDNGGAPDAMMCLAVTDCIPMYTQLRASGYQGTFAHPLYSDLLLGPMEGSVATTGGFNALSADTEGVRQLRADVAAFDPAAPVDTGTVAGYATTDMFIQALATVAAQGTEFITPENVRQAAAQQTWEIEGLAGPTRYPESSVLPTPACGSIAKATAAGWEAVVEYSCTETRYPVLDEFAG